MAQHIFLHGTNPYARCVDALDDIRFASSFTMSSFFKNHSALASIVNEHTTVAHVLLGEIYFWNEEKEKRLNEISRDPKQSSEASVKEITDKFLDVRFDASNYNDLKETILLKYGQHYDAIKNIPLEYPTHMVFPVVDRSVFVNMMVYHLDGSYEVGLVANTRRPELHKKGLIETLAYELSTKMNLQREEQGRPLE